MKIAILYIGTGRYSTFFRTFYDSSEQFFLNGIADKHYFVFTDDKSIRSENNISSIKRECKGFPYDSLFRFDMFLSIKEELLNYDYIFFFNANMLFVQPIGEEILPQKEGLVALVHPYYYNKPSFLYPYDRNRKSKAYISCTVKDLKYYMGSLNGGKSADYLKLIETCSKNIHTDFESGHIAFFHDESHLNKYLTTHNCLGLSPAYGFPEGKKIPFEPIILIRDKVKVDPYFKKTISNSPIYRLRRFLNTLYRIVIWYIDVW